MHRRKIAALALSVVALASTPAVAQEGGYVRVVTNRVQLGHQQHFESLLPKVWDVFKKAGVKSPSFVSRGVSDPSAFTFVMPLGSLADLSAMEEQLGKAFSAVPELTGELFGITTSFDDEIWAARPDLGYTPATQRVPMMELEFLRIALLYAMPGQIQGLEAELKARSEIRKKHDIPTAVTVVQLLIGRDGPVYGLLMSGKDEADFYAQNAKDVAKMGAEWQASLDKTGPMLRRVEFQTMSERPDLNYMP